jgi:hypothetical protein
MKIILIALIILLIITLIIKNNNKKEEFNTVITKLDYSAGFYSQLFFLINHYIYCKNNEINYIIDTDDWLFKYKDGWTDYFEPIILSYSSIIESKTVKHNIDMGEYTIQEYKNYIPEVYKYNQTTKNKIQNYINENKLTVYDSVFIRRGDKLASESNFYDEKLYLDLLLTKNPNCNNLFIQTDDYNCVIKINEIIKERSLNIKTHTLCEKSQVGTVVTNNQKGQILNSDKNKDYLDKIKEQLLKSKSVEDMDNNERYEHTITMLIGIDICSKSNICICDYQSNVSRFIKLFHNNSNNVYDVIYPNEDIDYNLIQNPSYGFYKSGQRKEA